MEFDKQKMCMNCFALLCAVITISLGSYWCYRFILNEDLSLVEYKEFYETKDDIFPTASLYLGHPFLREKLAEYGANETIYLAFLSGKTYAKDMLNINFEQYEKKIRNNYLLTLICIIILCLFS